MCNGIRVNVQQIYYHSDASNNHFCKVVYFLIGHYTYRMFPPAIDIIPTSLAVVYSNGKYTNYKN